MKTMKKLFYLSTVCCLVLLASCAKNKGGDEIIEGDFMCEVSAFGFFAEDNEGVINLDYIGDISGSTINISIPESVDKTALKARFTATEDDVVKVGTTVLESKVTSYDYSKIVDILVSDPKSKMSKVYTIKINKPAEKVWSLIGSYTKNSFDIKNSCVVMKINPIDNAPYISYYVDDATIAKVAVAKWNGESFVNVGKEAFSGKATGNVDINFDSKGTPYVAYFDADNGTAATVMSYSGAGWSVMGDPGMSGKAATAYGLALGMDKDDKPFVMATGDNKTDPNYRAAEMSYFNGAIWINHVVMPGRPAVVGTSYLGGKYCLKRYGDHTYIAMTNSGSIDSKTCGYSIYKYSSNGIISTVIEGSFIIDDKSNTSITFDISMDIASDGTIYMLIPDDTEGTWKSRVMTYKEGDAAPKKFASPINHTVTRFSPLTLALDNNDIPYVAYNVSDADKKLSIVSYDLETRAWTNPVIVSTSDVKTGSDMIWLDFDKNNIGYAAILTNEAPYVVELYKLAEKK